MAFALAAHAWLGGFREAIFGLAGLATGLGLFFVLYVSGGVGAGDVKLMGAIGAMVGPYGALVSGVLTLLVGGAYASGLLAYEWSLGKPGRMYEQASFQLRYSVAIAGGTLLFLAGVHPLG